MIFLWVECVKLMVLIVDSEGIYEMEGKWGDITTGLLCMVLEVLLGFI